MLLLARVRSRPSTAPRCIHTAPTAQATTTSCDHGRAPAAREPLSGQVRRASQSSCVGLLSTSAMACRLQQHRRLDGILGGRQPAAGVAGIPFLDPTIRLTRPGRESARVLLVGAGCPARGD